MAFKEYKDVQPDYWVTIGGTDKKGNKNPTSIEGYYMGRSVGTNSFDATKTKTTFMLKTPKGIAGVNGNANLVVGMDKAERNFNSKEGRSALGVALFLESTTEIATKKGNPMKVFSVLFNKEDSIEVDTSTFGSAGYNDSDAEEDESENDADNESSYEAAPTSRSSALSASERKAQVEALLKGKPRNPRD